MCIRDRPRDQQDTDEDGGNQAGRWELEIHSNKERRLIGRVNKAIGTLEYRERTRHYDILFQEASDFRLISTLHRLSSPGKCSVQRPKALD